MSSEYGDRNEIKPSTSSLSLSLSPAPPLPPSTPTSSSSWSLPPVVDCFHGFISENEAEFRLHHCGISGSMLCRAQPHSSSALQKYSISWLSSSKNSIVHFPIVRIRENYYLFGRSFSCLSDLIESFINEAKSIAIPLKPPSPIKLISRQRIALFSLCAIPNSDELSFERGDMLTEIQKIDEQWSWARLEKNCKSGLIPVQLTQPLNQRSIRPEELPYYHEKCIDVLNHRLADSGLGSYLLRRSHLRPNAFTLMVNCGTSVEKFLIIQSPSGYFEFGGRIFSTVPDIIERYSQQQLSNTCRLMTAVLCDYRVNFHKSAKINKLALENSHTILSTCAHRHCKDDKWKVCEVVLSSIGASQLHIYDPEKKTKPKIILDLHCCFVYKVDDCMLKRHNCLLVSLNSVEVCPSVLLSFPNEGIFLKWMINLRLRCLGVQRCSSPYTILPSPSALLVRFSTFIYLTIASFRGNGLRSGTEYTALVMINSIPIARTRPVVPMKNCITFDMPLLLEYIPAGSCTLRLQLCSYQSSTKVRTLNIREILHKEISPIYTLVDDGKELCVSADDSFDGFLFRAVRHRIVLLPEELYASFFVLLTARSFLFTKWTGSVLDSFNRTFFARVFLSVLLPNHELLLSFISELITEQIKIENDTTLFRGDSFCTCCISAVLRMIAKDLVVEELTRAHSDIDKFVDEPELFVRLLEDMQRKLPPLFRAIMAQVVQLVSSIFSNTKHASRRVVSVFFILRFINPILTFWNYVNSESYRHLAKILQTLANQASSLDYDTEKCSRATRAMADLMDSFAISPQVLDDAESPFNGFTKVEQFAMLAFQVIEVLENRSNECPCKEAIIVIDVLKANIKKYIKFDRTVRDTIGGASN